MKSIIVSTVVAAALSLSAFAGWEQSPMGICITNIVCHEGGLSVDFATDVPPPYRVAVHCPAEAEWSYCRARPIAYVDTVSTHAFVPCSLYDVAVFVQVYKANDRRIVPTFTRTMTDIEWKNYVWRVKRSPIKTIVSPDAYEDVADRDLASFDPYSMKVVCDGTWSGFAYTNATEISGTVGVYDRREDGSFETNYVSCAFSASGRDPSVGTGFRIMLFDGSYSGHEPYTLTTVAYSSVTNMSQEVLIKRGWKSLSSNGKWKISTDWEGYPVMIPYSNAVPYRIYGEGL